MPWPGSSGSTSKAGMVPLLRRRAARAHCRRSVFQAVCAARARPVGAPQRFCSFAPPAAEAARGASGPLSRPRRGGADGWQQFDWARVGFDERGRPLTVSFCQTRVRARLGACLDRVRRGRSWPILEVPVSQRGLHASVAQAALIYSTVRPMQEAPFFV